MPYTLVEEKISQISSEFQQELIDFVATQINITPQKNVNFKLKDSLVFTDTERSYTYCQLGEKYYRVITFKNSDPPDGVYHGVIRYLIGGGLGFEYRLSGGVRMVNKNGFINKVKRKKFFTHAMKYNFLNHGVDEATE